MVICHPIYNKMDVRMYYLLGYTITLFFISNNLKINNESKSQQPYC